MRHKSNIIRPYDDKIGDTHRITSYNVCYTKLLRARQHPFAVLFTPTLNNYREVFSSGLFGQAYLNSAFVALVGVALAVTFAAFAAFAFAHCRFRGRQVLFVLFLFV